MQLLPLLRHSFLHRLRLGQLAPQVGPLLSQLFHTCVELRQLLLTYIAPALQLSYHSYLFLHKFVCLVRVCPRLAKLIMR